MKNTFLYQLVLIFSTLTLSLSSSFGQTPVDALLMPKGTACAVVQHSSSSWENYWEGTLKRDNGNIGKFTMQSTAVMGAVGILSNRFNLIAMLPYISTSATAGTMAGQKGIQDLSVWGKYKIAEVQTKNGAFAVFGVLGASSPLTSYVPDMQPFSIGLGAKSASGKVILNYTANSGIYLTTHAGLTSRANIKIDRTSYQYDGNLINSNEVALPDYIEMSARLGFINSRFQTEIWTDVMRSNTGDDIRRQDMPFPTNKMEASSIGWMGKYTVGSVSLQANLSKVIAGRNFGENTGFALALLFTIPKVNNNQRCPARPIAPGQKVVPMDHGDMKH